MTVAVARYLSQNAQNLIKLIELYIIFPFVTKNHPR